jgi:hypothetical protein
MNEKGDKPFLFPQQDGDELERRHKIGRVMITRSDIGREGFIAARESICMPVASSFSF